MFVSLALLGKEDFMEMHFMFQEQFLLAVLTT